MSVNAQIICSSSKIFQANHKLLYKHLRNIWKMNLSGEVLKKSFDIIVTTKKKRKKK